MDTISRNVRLPAGLDATLREFCAVTRRQESHTIRGIVELFFADGVELAERRLSSGVWDVSPEPRTISRNRARPADRV